MTKIDKILEWKIEGNWEGERLDKFLVQQMKVEFAQEVVESQFSREYLQKLIAENNVQIFVDGKLIINKIKPGYKLRSDDVVKLLIPEVRDLELLPVKMDLKIVFEDEDILVLDKPAGLAVHAGEGQSHLDDSLVNGLLAHCGAELKGINGVKRPGIVHRLDKNTSGLMVVAKNNLAQDFLMNQFKDRLVKKKYLALAIGEVKPAKGRIEAAIGRSFSDRKKMQIDGADAKDAITEFVVLEIVELAGLGKFSLIDVNLLTGRTHQIRVHFAALGHALAGDEVYGKKNVNEKLDEKFDLKRQFLHATNLSFIHPRTKKELSFQSNPAADLEELLARKS